MPEGVLSPFLFRLSPQLLLSQAWPVRSRAECLLFYSHSALLGSLLKGILAFSSRPGVWFRQQQKLSWQIKGSGPQNYGAHSICIYCVILSASDKGGGGEEEKMEDRLLHSCVFTLTCLISERGGQTVYSEAINQPFSIRLSSTLQYSHIQTDKGRHYYCCWHIFINHFSLGFVRLSKIVGWLWCSG